jgi:hypothetical protein
MSHQVAFILIPLIVLVLALILGSLLLIFAGTKALRRRERNAPPPPVLDEFDADVARMQQRVANLEEILLNASRVR